MYSAVVDVHSCLFIHHGMVQDLIGLLLIQPVILLGLLVPVILPCLQFEIVNR